MDPDPENAGPSGPADEFEETQQLAGGDDEAEEVPEGEEEEDAGDGEDEGPGEDLQDSSDEDEGEGNEYDVTDKFLVADDDEAEDNDEEGAEGDAAARRRKKRRRRREAEEELDEEDYELIGQAPPRRGQHKRIRKLAQPATGRQHATAEDIREELFGKDEDNDDLQDVDEEDAAAQRRAERQRREQEVDDLDDDDEFADFLDDDEDAGDGRAAGQPRRRRRSALARALPSGVSAEAFQEAQDIFGDADELLEEFRARPRLGQQQEPPSDEEDIDPEDLGDDEDARAERLRAVEERRKAKEIKKITERVEPEMLARAMLRSEDDVIRTTDVPEREQLRPSPEPGGWRDPESTTVDDCAKWILDRLLPPVDDMLFEEDSQKASALRHAHALETELLLLGRREVDGPSESPASSDGLYARGELVEDVTDLSRGQRAVRDVRSSRVAQEWRESETERESLLESIRGVVLEIFTSHNEVPFIAVHRKQMLGELLCGRREDMPDVVKVSSSRLPKGLDVGMVRAIHRRIRRWDILWKVYDLAVQWRAMARRQEARAAGIEEAKDRPEATDDDYEALSTLSEAVRTAQSPEEIADIDAKFRLKLAASNGRLEDAMEAVALHEHKRRPQRRSVYEVLLKAGLEPVVRQIYMTAEGFAGCIDSGYRTAEVPQISDEPKDFAAQFINPGRGLTFPEDVLNKAQEMAICELIAEPRVRKAVREPFFKRALVSTEPTVQGEQLLDPFHVCGRVKRIRDKPVQSFCGSDTFLRIAQAEKEGLIEVRIGMDEETLKEDIIKQMVEFYTSSDTARIAQAWNSIRESTVRKAIMERLLPALSVELRSKLLAEARDAVLHRVSDRLWDWASQAPHQVLMGEDESPLPMEQRRFAALCWGPGDPATAMVMLNEQGQLVDVLYLGQLSGAIRRTRRNAQGSDDIFTDVAKIKDAERLRDFLVQHTPHKIFVGASCMHCGQLYEDLQKVLDHMLDKMPSIFTRSDTGKIDLGWADESLATLWETSQAALQEMSDQLPLVRRAIALVRCQLDALAVLSALCGPSAEILSMDLHPLKELLPRQALLTAAERICIIAVNQVGLDINVVAHSAWQQAPLQFVAGLGPRKAQLLARSVQREEFVASRNALWKELGVMERVVFRNCGSFLRTTHSSEEAEAEGQLALDATRVAPQLYPLAKDLAKAILDEAGGWDPEDDWVLQAHARPNEVEGFNLQEYAVKIQEPDQLTRLTQLREISFELVAPAGELRRQQHERRTTDVFYMLCGESRETLREGREVSAIVTFAGARDVLVRLPDFGNAEGVCTPPASDGGPQQPQPRDLFVRDQAIRVRVLGLVDAENQSNLSKLSVVLVDEQEDPNNDKWEEKYCKEEEPWYHILTREEREKALNEKRRASKGRQLINRPIRHPNFRNMTALQASEDMRDAEVGTCLFRPSSKGTDRITLTIKVHKRTDDGLGNDAYFHKEVMEGPKGAAVGAHLKLGRPLEIDHLGFSRPEQYEDLDEILARFAEPFVSHIKQIKGHRKYREGPQDHVLAQLAVEKERAGAGKGAYVLGAKQDLPGSFYLAFIINTKPHREFMVVTPDGIYFRHEVRKSTEHVIAVWKRDPTGDRVSRPEPPAAPPQPAARTSRFSAQPPAGQPGQAGGGLNASHIKVVSYMPAQQRPQAQQASWQQQRQQQQEQPPLPPPEQVQEAGLEAWMQQQAQAQQQYNQQQMQQQPAPQTAPWEQQAAQQQPQQQMWAPAPANGYPPKPPQPLPPPPQQPVPSYQAAYGRR